MHCTFYEGGGDPDDMQMLEGQKKEKNNFKLRKAARWEHVAAQEGTVYVFMKSVGKEQARTNGRYVQRFRTIANGFGHHHQRTVQHGDAKEHGLWRMIEGACTRVWCR